MDVASHTNQIQDLQNNPITEDILQGIKLLIASNSQSNDASSNNQTADHVNNANTYLRGIEAEAAASQLSRFVQELLRWNKAFNLTAITQINDVITHHILDSLSLSPHLTGDSILDVGTGAGLPGIPLAIANPGKQFVLVDSNNKKLKFIRQVIGLLELQNVKVVHSRIEQLNEGQFDVVTSRAFASINDFIQLAGQHCKAKGRVLAMKGLTPDQEISKLPSDWKVESIAPLLVPNLQAARCLVNLQKAH